MNGRSRVHGWKVTVEDKPKDWYEAFADEAHRIRPGWRFTTDLTPEEERRCEEAADKVAIRPDAEK